MREGNVDTSRIPKFSSEHEVRDYFSKFAKLNLHGREGITDWYYVQSFTDKFGRVFFLDIFPDGRYVLIRHK